MADEFVAEESYGENSLCSQYFVSRTDGELRKRRLYQRSGVTAISKFMKDAFLPQGYPHSVSSDYLEYQIWDTCQAFCSSIVGALAAQAMLKAYGVGDEKATVLAATLTWLLKDGAGMVGRIVFTWLKGTELDCHAKKWRLVADVINDLTYLIELLAPMFKEYFLLFACMSSICRSLVAVSGGSTRAALTQHQARRDNMADVSAKDGSQETMVNLMAFLVNLVLIPLVTGKQRIIWLLFCIFTSLHLYCNFRAVSAVVMETVNSTRMHLLVENYISNGIILSPKSIADIEPILRREKSCLNVNLGCEFNKVVTSSADMHAVIGTAGNYLHHILKLQITKDFKAGSVHVVLHRNINSVSLLQCYFQIAILDLIIQTPQLRTKGTRHNEMSEFALNNLCSLWQSLYNSKELPSTASWDMVHYAHKFTEASFPDFLERLEARGWVTSRSHLGPDEWRADWNLYGGSNTDLRNTRNTKEI